MSFLFTYFSWQVPRDCPPPPHPHYLTFSVLTKTLFCWGLKIIAYTLCLFIHLMFPQLLPAYLRRDDPSQVYRSLNVIFDPLLRLCVRDFYWETWVERGYQRCPLVAGLLCLTFQWRNTHVENNSLWAFYVSTTSPKWSTFSPKQVLGSCVSCKSCQSECGGKIASRSSVWGKEAFHFSSGSPGS